MIDFLLFALYKMVKPVLVYMPKFVVIPLLRVLGWLTYGVDREHRRYAKANLDLVYQDELDEIEKEEIIRASYDTMFMNLYAFIKNQSASIEELQANTLEENAETIIKAIQDERKIILVTAHYGYWEYGSIFIPIKYKPTTMVGRPLNNKYLNKELNETRARFNTEMLDKKNASKGMIRALKNDRIVGLVVDQHHYQGIDTVFMGHKVKHVDSASRLAVKFDAVIIPVFFQCYEVGKYKVKFYDAIDPREYECDDKIQELTQKQAECTEHQIRQEPGYWLWQHRRWKAYHSEIYKR